MTESSSEYFQGIAKDWDSLRAGYFTEAVRDTAIAKAYLHPGMVVADVGAGTGFIAAGLAPLVRRVYVVDGSAAMLDVARKNLSGLMNVEFHEADGLALPFPDESLDAVFANMYLHHTTDPLASIREMLRVLRPGGRLVITDMDSHPYAWLKDEMADVWQGFERDQMRVWYREAGLVNVVVDGTGQTCQASSEGSSAAGSCCEDGACDCAGDATCDCTASMTAAGAGEQQAKITIFVAAGTRRMQMRQVVQERYGEYARSSSSCCGSSAQPASAGLYELDAAKEVRAGGSPAASSCCGGGDSSCCGGAEASMANASTADANPAAAQSSCCGSSAVSTGLDVEIVPDYSQEDFNAVPQEAAEIPLGCGNPVAIANLKPGEVVLDIGSGGGLDAFLAAGKVGEQGRVIGVDMTPDMLSRARAAAERAAITNVEFRQGYAEALPVEDGLVDVIISNCVINLTEDKGQVFREAFRILKPGGRLEVSDMVLSGPLPVEARESAQGWAACVTGALPEREYLDLVAQAGFKRIALRRSPASGEADGVKVYSAIVSAVKE